MALRKKYQRGGVTGASATNVMNNIMAQQKRQQLLGLQDMWKQYQKRKWAEGVDALNMQDVYGAGGSKGGGLLGNLLGEALWGGDEPWMDVTYGFPLANKALDYFGMGNISANLNPLLEAVTTAGLSYGGSKLARGKAPEVSPPTWEEFIAESGFDPGDSKFHPSMLAAIKSGALIDVTAFDEMEAMETGDDDLTDILSAFSDMAFFSELRGDDKWMQSIIDMFDYTPISEMTSS